MTLEKLLKQPTPSTEMIRDLVEKEFSLIALSKNVFGCKLKGSTEEIIQWLRQHPNEELASHIAALKKHLHFRKKVLLLSGPNISTLNITGNAEFDFCNGVKLEDFNNMEPIEFRDNLASCTMSFQPYPRIWSFLSLEFSSNNEEDYKLSEKIAVSTLEETLICIQLTLMSRSCVQAVGSIDLSVSQLGFIEPFSPLLRLPYFEPRTGAFTSIHLQQANSLLTKFSQLEPQDKAVIKLAASRLHQFYSSAPHVDRAISLRIAMESIFCAVHETEAKAKLIKKRAKRYILNEMRKIATEFNSKSIQSTMYDAYDMTSTCVHTGQSPEDISKLDDAASITKESIKKYIRTGVSPITTAIA